MSSTARQARHRNLVLWDSESPPDLDLVAQGRPAVISDRRADELRRRCAIARP